MAGRDNFLEAQQLITAVANVDGETSRQLTGEMLARPDAADIVLALAGYSGMLAKILAVIAAPPGGEKTPEAWLQVIGLQLAQEPPSAAE